MDDKARALEYADRLTAAGIRGDRGQIASLFFEAITAEREKCARVAEDFEAQVRNKITKTVDMQWDFGAIYASKGIAAAIRARGR